MWNGRCGPSTARRDENARNPTTADGASYGWALGEGPSRRRVAVDTVQERVTTGATGWLPQIERASENRDGHVYHNASAARRGGNPALHGPDARRRTAGTAQPARRN